MPDNYDLSNQFAQPNPQYSFADLVNLASGGGQQQGQGQPQYSTFRDPTEMWRQVIQMYQQQQPEERAWKERMAQQFYGTPEQRAMAEANAIVHARRYSRDPVGAAIADKNAQEVAKGGLDWFHNVNRIPVMSREAAIGNQGNSAVNQWAQRGAYEDIDPEQVKKFTVNRRFPSYT